MSYTNTSPIAFPTRAAQHVLGTNPIAVAAPSTDSQGYTPLRRTTRHATRHTWHTAHKQLTQLVVVIGWAPTDPFVLDMATTTVALGKVEIRDREERQCPAGWGGSCVRRVRRVCSVGA
jgi:hypothetical protein